MHTDKQKDLGTPAKLRTPQAARDLLDEVQDLLNNGKGRDAEEKLKNSGSYNLRVSLFPKPMTSMMLMNDIECMVGFARF